MARGVSARAEFHRARRVGVFLSLPTEIDTAPLIELARQEGKTVAVPVVFPQEGRMRFAVLPAGRPKLKKNVYGILEPLQPEWVNSLDLVIVPGAAFTDRGDRLGAGAGYYDRFLSGRSRPKSIGICFDEQRAVRLPCAPHDRRVDVVVTPKGLFWGGDV
ncbi:MAG: 5-formyltetrahydrofolate cyclo-ligase [Elusimicrobia bacterium]|nr:5-formyltetrahydrofolate cyclo-ligase [Elusimicrobiota bacterium]